jgi:hypothetical protein
MRPTLPLLALALLTGCATTPPPVAGLQPDFLVPDQVVFADDFSVPRELKGVAAKSPLIGAWNPNQGTRWAVADGVLRGEASTAAFQAAHETHKGIHPRIVLTKTPASYILRCSFRLLDGLPYDAAKRRSVPPFLEIGHHIARLTWTAQGASLLADGDSLVVDANKEYRLRPGQWVTVLIERRDDEVVVRFQDGPAFYARHPSYRSDLHAVMFGGLEAGHMEIDDVTVWSVKPDTQRGWEAWRTAHPTFAPVRIKDAKTPSDQ